MRNAEGDEPSQEKRPRPTELDRQYGKIGISAVAAAVRYQSDAKNPAYAPTAVRSDDRSDDMAA
jgi:hypothetical protein